MQRSPRVGRQRKMLLAVVAVASGVTISCGSEGIGLYDAGWNEVFDAAAKKDAAGDASDAESDASVDSAVDASNDAADAADGAAD